MSEGIAADDGVALHYVGHGEAGRARSPVLANDFVQPGSRLFY
ncbi:MAG: hypothetical protein DCF25_14035 [Leptolyngbya foveolarum]|uniref:Uncharacterized protein n=1 Tax=Leptolyngbya foveolarum TaxID=47253 RepID=A0A2W4W7I9_9CYAN|nr:MAG: hypothetical protein DCF25_14035 [Leptolyngbya foveolarum]